MSKAYKNLHAIPTKTISAILSHPYAQGIDGADYWPVKEELQNILWERQAREGEREESRWQIEFKKEMKEKAKTTKTKNVKRKIYE